MKIMESDYTDNYKAIADTLINMAKNNDDQEKIKKILYSGKTEYFDIDSEMMNKDNTYISLYRAIEYAYLIATYPDTFDVIEHNGINLFHGTDVSALPSILKYGMMSFSSALNNNIPINTGEQLSLKNGVRDFISMTDNIGVATSYAISNNNDSFGIVLGFNKEEIKNIPTRAVHSDILEVGFTDNIPPQSIGFIGVSYDKVEIVKKIVNDSGLQIDVMPIDFGNRFYFYEHSFIDFYPDLVDEVINRTKNFEANGINSDGLYDTTMIYNNEKKHTR